MNYCIKHGYRLLFLDEIIFQNNDIKMGSYSNKKININLYKKKRYGQNITVIAVIDINGLVQYKKLNGFVNG